MSVTRPITEVPKTLRNWEQALLLPDRRVLEESLEHELAEYLGESRARISELCRSGTELVAEDWRSSAIKSTDDIARITTFYQDNRTYLYDLTAFNARYPHAGLLEWLLKEARALGFHSVLDFGAGIGSVGVFFAANGMEVTLADISQPLMEYARWRFTRRGLRARFIDLTREELPENAFRVITSFDVFEHLPRPRTALRAISRSMMAGGLFAFNVEVAGSRFPQHVTGYDDVMPYVRAAGFAWRKAFTKADVFERVDRGSIATACYSALDPLWYRGLRRPSVRVLERIGVKDALKRLVRRPP
jgi:SAM-dependent methyltransferase